MDSHGQYEQRVVWAVVGSGMSPLLLAATPDGLVNVVFHATDAVRDRALERLAARLGTEPAEDPGSPLLAEAIRQVEAYFAGERHTFELPLDWSLISGSTGRCCASWPRACRTALSWAMATWPGGSVSRAGRRRWARRWAPTRCRSSCRATGWWRATAASASRRRSGGEAEAARPGGRAARAAVDRPSSDRSAWPARVALVVVPCLEDVAVRVAEVEAARGVAAGAVGVVGESDGRRVPQAGAQASKSPVGRARQRGSRGAPRSRPRRGASSCAPPSRRVQVEQTVLVDADGGEGLLAGGELGDPDGVQPDGLLVEAGRGHRVAHPQDDVVEAWRCSSCLPGWCRCPQAARV